MTSMPHPTAPDSPPARLRQRPRRVLAGTVGLLLTVGLAVFGISQPASAVPTVRADVAPGDAEIETMLNDLIVPLVRSARNENLRNVVYDMVREQFDGDTNVLFENLIPRAEAQGAVAPSDTYWQQVKAGVDRFATLTNGTYKPQIYIPNFGEVARAPRVTIGYAPQDESVQTTVGWRQNIFGMVRPAGIIDEASMVSTETWILSLNERVGWNQVDIAPTVRE